MPNSPSQVAISIPTASVDGKFHGRYPAGNAPNPSPSSPTGVSAVPANAVTSLYWTPSAGATSYKIKRSTTAGGPYATVGTATQGFFSDTGRTNGTTYYYVISAVNTAGESVNSAQVSAAPLVYSTTPANVFSFSPTSGSPGTVVTLTAVSSPGNFTGCCSAYSGILSGTFGAIHDGALRVIDDSHCQYTVPVDCETGQFFLSNISGGGQIAFAGPPYTFTFIATVAPNAPTGVTAVAGSSGTNVALAWNTPPGATSFIVLRSLTSGSGYTSIATPTANSFTDNAVTTGTTYYYVVEAVNTVGNSPNSAEVNATPTAPAVGSVTVALAAATTKPISPLIYGLNQFGSALAPAFITNNRYGGNRWTAWNWQTGASNSGTDLNPPQNDTYLDGTGAPAHAITSRITTDRSNNLTTLMTYPTQGYVAADTSGPVANTGTSVDTARFKTVQFVKGSAFTTTPSNANASVYGDEMLFAIDQAFAGQGIFSATPTTQAVHIELDNEPDIWFSTHPEVQTSTEISYTAFASKCISAATAIKTQFPNANIYAPATSNYASLFEWQGPSFNGAGVTAIPPPYTWWMDTFLASFKTASNTFGAPLLDVFSYHWYTEVIDPVTNAKVAFNTRGTTLPDATIQALVQSPRSLWDPYFIENSYIPQGGRGAAMIIPSVQAKLVNSGLVTKQAQTEYFNGGDNHIAGLITQADNLGVFGAQGLYAAHIWPLTAAPYPLAAFRCFRNFDGAGAKFGDTSVLATSSNTVAVAISSGSANIAVANISNGSIVGMPVTFSATVGTGAGGIVAGTKYFVTSQSSTAIQVATVVGGTPITFNAAGTPNVSYATDVNVSAYVSTDSTQPSRVVMVLINRSFTSQVTTVAGQALTGTAHLWRVTATSATGQNPIIPVSAGTQAVSGSSITVTLPALSVTTIDIH